MNKSDWIIIWLSIQVSIMGWGWMRAEKQAAYCAGRLNAFIDSAKMEDGETFDCSKEICGKISKK